jgi:serine phosphatase RsbU (regulator of sigma subunit)
VYLYKYVDATYTRILTLAIQISDKLSRDQYLLQSRQREIEALLLQEKEKMRLEEERLKQELEYKYRQEAELKIRFVSTRCLASFVCPILFDDEFQE